MHIQAYKKENHLKKKIQELWMLYKAYTQEIIINHYSNISDTYAKASLFQDWSTQVLHIFWEVFFKKSLSVLNFYFVKVFSSELS